MMRWALPEGEEPLTGGPLSFGRALGLFVGFSLAAHAVVLFWAPGGQPSSGAAQQESAVTLRFDLAMPGPPEVPAVEPASAPAPPAPPAAPPEPERAEAAPLPPMVKPKAQKPVPSPAKKASLATRKPAAAPPETARAESPAKTEAAAPAAMAAPSPPTDRQGGAPGQASPAGPVVVTEPKFLRPPSQPRYPERARDRNEEGTVVVRALVETAGEPEDVVVWRSSGHRLLDRAALKAVRRWEFAAAQSSGRIVTAWVEVPVTFRLR